MTPERLYEKWEEGERGFTPAQIQYHREDLMDICDRYIPHRRSVLDNWIDRFQGQITQELQESVEENNEDNSKEDDG